MKKRQKVKLWKQKFYPNSERNFWGINEKPLAVFFKLSGFDLLKLRKEKRYHLDMFCSEESFLLLVKRESKYLKSFLKQEYLNWALKHI